MPDSRIWELLARKYNNEISNEELLEMERLLQQPGAAFHLNELLTDLHGVPLQKITSPSDEAKSREAIKRLIVRNAPENRAEVIDGLSQTGENRLTSKKSNSLFLWTAACIVIGISIWLFAPVNSPKPQLTAHENEVVTSGGSKSTIYLPDGSSVILNTGSKLSYNKDFGVKTREIYLNGEAFFKIAKNEKVPLIVHAGEVDIQVKGTIFNVKAYPEDSTVEASLIQGAIEVFSKNDAERKILMRPNEKIVIGNKTTAVASSAISKPATPAKEAIIFLGKIKPNPIDSSITEIAWIQNKLTFYKEPFSSLAEKMESWYNVSIQFNDEKLGRLTFTGSFEKEDIKEALGALNQITHFEYSIENRNIIISKSKQK